MTRAQASTAVRPLFRSFWLASFADGDHLSGMRRSAALDVRDYRARVEADYGMVRDAGIGCVREGVGWRRVERGDAFDFTTVTLRAECARDAGLQVAWTLCRDGWPDGIDVSRPQFVERFRRLARATARTLAPYAGPEGCVYTPVDEISFLAWALAETGLVGPPRSDLRHRGDELEVQLVRAALAGCDAILEVDADARFLHSEPATSAVASTDAEASRGMRVRAFDMLSGRLEPQLGGHARYVDALAIHCRRRPPAWRGARDGAAARTGDTRPAGLSRVLEDVYARYRCPVAVAESDPSIAGRAEWLRHLGDEIGGALERGVPVAALCVSRVVEHPAWEDPRHWRARRLWDVLLPASGDAPLVSDSAYEQALRDVRSRIDPLVGASLSRNWS